MVKFGEAGVVKITISLKRAIAVTLCGLLSIVCAGADTILNDDTNYGDIILVDDSRSIALANVSYTITKEDRSIITGISDSYGWIRLDNAIKGKYTLSLYWDADWDAYEPENPNEIDTLTEHLYTDLGYNDVFVEMKWYDDNIDIELEGGKKYIITPFSVFEISQ